ncbi:DUF5677 domain-containing protein [Paenibacillus sp. IHBB 10380]|uniref:DUF5677 domain-containing protein n=1 Tax=Paenibacillus sp. IHBB 10380 TaxID=1566358 RepID=UPI0005CFC591|nr:DUF5677 domain-containing protein [Paenibacillus sp. IHBB 10380]AJS59998.1 hypothetical protein UB51_17695 [Paenibacillus sp. IHBB 10380]
MDFECEGFLGIEADSLMEEALEDYAPWFNLAYDVNRLVNEIRQSIQVDGDQHKEILIHMLVTKISNHFQSIILLLKKGLSVEADILVRSMLESVIPIRLLVIDEKFFDEFVRNDKANKYSLYNVLLDKRNENVFEVAKIDATKRDELKDELSPFFKDGKIRTFKTEELAIRSGMNMDYQLAYRYLSGYVHSSFDTLEKAYLIIEEGELVAFNYGHYTEPYPRILFSSMYFVLKAIEHVNEYFNVDKKEEIEIIVKGIQSLNAKQ